MTRTTSAEGRNCRRVCLECEGPTFLNNQLFGSNNSNTKCLARSLGKFIVSVFVVCASVVKLCEVLCLCNYFFNFLWEILACVCAGMEDIRMVVVKVCAGVLM